MPSAATFLSLMRVGMGILVLVDGHLLAGDHKHSGCHGQQGANRDEHHGAHCASFGKDSTLVVHDIVLNHAGIHIAGCQIAAIQRGQRAAIALRPYNRMGGGDGKLQIRHGVIAIRGGSLNQLIVAIIQACPAKGCQISALNFFTNGIPCAGGILLVQSEAGTLQSRIVLIDLVHDMYPLLPAQKKKHPKAIAQLLQ